MNQLEKSKIRPSEPRARPPLRTPETAMEDDTELVESYEEFRRLSSTKIYREERSRRQSTSIDQEWQEVDSSLSVEYSSEDRQESETEYTPEDTVVRKRVVQTQSYKKYASNPGQEKPRDVCTLVVVTALVLFVCVLCANSMSLKVNSSSEGEEKAEILEKVEVLHEGMKTIPAKFCNQEARAWNDIFSGMHNIILHPKKPLIVTLFSNERKTMNCLAKALGELSVAILATDGYLTLTPEDFGTDAGEVIHRLKPRIQEKRVAIVQDLLRINAGAIKAFHNFCDRECPLVENAVYIIAVVIDGDQSVDGGTKLVETEISKAFSASIEPDILSPLVTRILDGAVVHVEPCPRIHDDCTLRPD